MVDAASGVNIRSWWRTPIASGLAKEKRTNNAVNEKFKNSSLIRRTSPAEALSLVAVIAGAILGFFGISNDSIGMKNTGGALTIGGIVAAVITLFTCHLKKPKEEEGKQKTFSIDELKKLDKGKLIAMTNNRLDHSQQDQVVGIIRERFGFDEVRKLITHENLGIREYAIKQLFISDNDKAIEELKIELQNPNVQIKGQIIEGLGNSKDDKVIDLLISLWTEENNEFTSDIVNGIKKFLIGRDSLNKTLESEKAKKIVDFLVKISEADSAYSSNAILALGYVNNKLGVDALYKILIDNIPDEKDKKSDKHRMFTRAVNGLHIHYQHQVRRNLVIDGLPKDAQVRKKLQTALNNLKNQTPVPQNQTLEILIRNLEGSVT